MDLVQFILAFFASKRVSMLTAFICWTSEEFATLWREGTASGARFRVVRPGTPLPSLLPYDLRREGILLDLGCSHAAQVLEQASASRAFNHRHTWLFLHNSTLEEAVTSILDLTLILPDADVTCLAGEDLGDVYRIKAGLPFKVYRFDVNTNCTDCLESFWARLPTPVTRRKDLENVYLKAETIVSQPQYFKGWADFRNRQIDTFPKLTYPIMMLAAEDLNFRYNLRQVDLYGEEHNGTFNGLAGSLQRGDVEIGIASIFMRGDRWRVLHYCAETVELRGSFLFRQPSQSAVSNVFLLPFSRGLWLSLIGAVVIISAAIALQTRALKGNDPTLKTLTLFDIYTFAIGSLSQQGFHMSPGVASVRMVMFFTLMLALFSFTAYSAKIVSILQSPSSAIKTITDLTHSPMTMGVQETTYKKTYFAESTDPATQQLYRRKLLPIGDAAYLSVVDGIARVRTGLFAFQVEESAGYDVISQTYTESEKCGLAQVKAFTLPMVSVPVRRHSGYRDLLAARLRWQRETGLMSRVKRTWMVQRPRCDGASGFVSIGITDVLPALQVLGVGGGVALLLLVIERALFLWRRVHARKTEGIMVSVLNK